MPNDRGPAFATSSRLNPRVTISTGNGDSQFQFASPRVLAAHARLPTALSGSAAVAFPPQPFRQRLIPNSPRSAQAKSVYIFADK